MKKILLTLIITTISVRTALADVKDFTSQYIGEAKEINCKLYKVRSDEFLSTSYTIAICAKQPVCVTEKNGKTTTTTCTKVEE